MLHARPSWRRGADTGQAAGRRDSTHPGDLQASAASADLKRVSQPPPSWPQPRTGAALPQFGRPVRRQRVLPLLLVVAVAAVAALQALHDDVRYYRVTSGSMEPTLAVSSRVQVEAGVGLRAGEIVAFYAPAGALPATPVCGAPAQGAGFQRPCDLATAATSSQVLIKRIVAGPGDRVSLDFGRAVVNDVTRNERFPVSCTDTPTCDFPAAVRVPADSYYVLGDNRGASDDSRFWGPVAASSIIGVVVRCGPLQTACHPVG